jgi:alcohol dehydrogenase
MGIGSTRIIGELLAARAIKRTFVVVDPVLRHAPVFSALTRQLDQAGLSWTAFSDIEPDPGSDAVSTADAQCQRIDAELVIAIGGGSSIDVAKAAAILATNRGRIHDYEGIEKFAKPPLPLIAIPTTAGTGSEVSGSCVITDSQSGRKMSIRHARLNPASEAILDPTVLASLPAHVAIHAGIDAFVHAFESFISRQANLITDAINLQAIELISGNIRRFVADRTDLEAGQRMLVGSCLAGMTFGQTGLGNVHCIARFIGARYHLSHGLSNALCLTHVARFNAPAAQERYAKVAQAMGYGAQPMSDKQAPELAIKAIEQLCSDLQIPSRLRDAGIDVESLPSIAQDCFKADYSRWNPRQTSESDFLRILQEGW